MITSKIIEGLTILQKYYDKDGFHCGAEHDVIYAYATDKPVGKQDLDRLIDLGWFQEGATNDEGELPSENYDPSESWACFT